MAIITHKIRLNNLSSTDYSLYKILHKKNINYIYIKNKYN